MEVSMFKSTSALRLALIVATLCATSVSLTACAAAMAAGRSERAASKMKDRFDEADTDHDGFISRDEASKSMPRIAPHFDDADTNHDGKLSQDEIAAYLRNLRGSR
jgi:Ca2+-binding EF-hand superfamily protein